jgi:hypothetical protein
VITDGAIKHGKSRETGNTGHTRRRKTKQKHKAIRVGHQNIAKQSKKHNAIPVGYQNIAKQSKQTQRNMC